MIEDRRKIKRFDVEVALTWSIDSQNIQGEGQLLDVSRLGACFRMQQPFTAKAGLVFTIAAPDVPALPRRGKLNWYRKLPGRAPMFLCGVVFEEPIGPEWEAWLEQAVGTPHAQPTA